MSRVPADEHLRAALRHAPDAGLAAPDDISAQILAAAHRAAAERPAVTPRRRHWLAGFSPWQLATSGALASVLMAGFITLLWRGEPPPAVTARPAPVEASAPAPVQAPAVVAAEAPAAPAAGTPAAASADAAAVPRAAAVLPPTGAARVQPAPPPAGVDRKIMSEAPAAQAAENARSVQASGDVADPTLRQRPALPPAPPAAFSLPLPSLQATAPTAPETTAVPAGRLQTAALPAPTPDAARKAAPAGAAAMLTARAPLQDNTAGMAVALPSDLQWRVDGRLHTAPPGWLMQMQHATRAQGAWQSAPGATPQPGEQEVAWSSGNVVLGRVWLGRGRVLWCTPDNHCETALLSPQAARDLMARLVPQ